MATKAINQVSRIGQRRQVVIPQAICRQLKLAAGDFVQIEEHEGMVLIRPRHQPVREEVLTSREAAVVRRGMKEFKDGKTVAWRDLAPAQSQPRPPRQGQRSAPRPAPFF